MHTRAQGHTGRLAEQNQSRAASWGHRRQQRERQHPRWLHTDPNLLCLGLIWANAGHRAGVPAAHRAQQPPPPPPSPLRGPCSHPAATATLLAGPKETWAEGAPPRQPLTPSVPAPCSPSHAARPGPSIHPSWCWSSRPCRGRHCVPDFPFFRLIAPVAAEPGVKHLIFYSRIELENTINISLQLKDPSQPGTRS